MIVTNESNLHNGIFNAINKWMGRSRNPDPDYYRVTELVRPVQQVLLQRRHNDEITVDAMDMLNAFRGSAVHELLSKYDAMNALQEEFLDVEIGGHRVKGIPDYYDGNDFTLVDFKNCRVWKYVYQDFSDWEEQTNIYDYMLFVYGFKVKKLYVAAMFDDWSPTRAKASKDYPQHRAVVIPLKKWSRKKQRQTILKKIERLEAAKHLKDEDLPPCSYDDMWEKPTVYAVMKQERKTSIKNYENDEEGAQRHVNELTDTKKGTFYVEMRPGERTRCEHYCSASEFCYQFKMHKLSQEEQEEVA